MAGHKEQNVTRTLAFAFTFYVLLWLVKFSSPQDGNMATYTFQLLHYPISTSSEAGEGCFIYNSSNKCLRIQPSEL